MEIIEEEEISQEHILGPQGEITYIPKRCHNKVEASKIIAQLNNEYMLIVMGEVNGTTYYQFLRSWSCWANDKMLGEDYWSINESGARPDKTIPSFKQMVTMNAAIYMVVTIASELLNEVLLDLWNCGTPPLDSTFFELDPSNCWSLL
jgi:hypothetical protein